MSIRIKAAAICIALAITAFFIFTYHSSPAQRAERTTAFVESAQVADTWDLAIEKEIRAIYSHIILPVDTPTFLGKSTGNQIWSSLGKKLCIADCDTRFYNHHGQILSDSFSWSATDALSAGMFNHFIYAAIHGYSYHMIHSEKWPNSDRDNVWAKLPQIKSLLQDCDIVVMVDDDVVFQHLELPFEWLLNRWNMTKETALAMPWDTEYRVQGRRKKKLWYVYDDKGMLSINAGVTVAQNLDITREILQAWIDCPDEIKDCAKYRHGWPAEQGAFINHIRYKYNDSLTAFDCNDANGFPEQGMDCEGTFLRHYTTDKKLVKGDVGQVLLDGLTKVFTRQRLTSIG